MFSSLWLKSDLYLRYHIEDLITPLTESVQANFIWYFVFAYYVMILTNQIAYLKRIAVFLKMTKSFSLLSVA